MDCPHIPLMWNSYPKAYEESSGVDVGSSYSVDTALCLNSHPMMAPGSYDSGSRKRKCNDETSSLKDEISLDIGLGSCLGFTGNKRNLVFGTAVTSGKEVREQSRPIDICLDLNLEPKEVISPSSSLSYQRYGRPKIDLELSLSAATESDVTSVTLASSPNQSSVLQLVDDDSTSSNWKRGHFMSHVQQHIDVNSRSVHPDINANLPSVPPQPAISVDMGSSDSKPQRKGTVKICQFPGCEKGARGASGHCISHGGGRRCQRLGCQKGAEGRTAFCKAHGGGRRCEHLGCTKSAEGRTDLCIAHGGGKRCGFSGGCTRAARGKSGLCIRHGGGKRCKIENCSKSAEGVSGLCIAHGGGRRCQHVGCSKGAQGSTKFCKAHGGGKRCAYLGCSKGAEGSTPFCKAHGGGKRCTFQGGGVCTKSVHGGTLFCVAHGGGKRCAASGCTKSARGRTNFCVRHGGGKRCQYEGCGKSAQGSTDFCKAHGGGKRCMWGHPGSGFGDNAETPCDKFARGKVGLCAAHTAQVDDKRVHGDGTVGLKMKEIMSGDDRFVRTSKSVGGENSAAGVFNLSGLNLGPLPANKFNAGEPGETSGSLPEGRVHGGSLMALLRASASTEVTAL